MIYLLCLIGFIIFHIATEGKYGSNWEEGSEYPGALLMYAVLIGSEWRRRRHQRKPQEQEPL